MKKVLQTIFLYTLAGSAVLLLTFCNRNGGAINDKEELPSGVHAVSIIEVVQGKNYTYLQVFEHENKYWIAVAARDAKAGDLLYFSDAMEMKDFESKELGRTFPVIYFVQDPSNSPDLKNKMTTGHQSNERRNDVSIAPPDKGISLETLFRNSKEYENKTIKVRGLVVKVNKNIMGKNWVHLQDGSYFNDQFDLTITTNQTVEKGDTLTAEGRLLLNKDFGSGYHYDVLVEQAVLTDIKPHMEETRL